MNKKNLLHLCIGPALFLLLILALPDEAFGSTAAKSAVGVVAWMAYWWVTRPVDLAVTAFLPIVVNAFIAMTAMSSVIANYFSETIILLFGSSILSASMEITGLDKRIAVRCLGIIGENLRRQMIFWFTLPALLSAFLPNAVVCATVTPIAVSMLRYAGEGDIRNSRIGSKLLLYIAYGVGVGGLISPLGGAMNLVTVDYLQQVSGTEFMYYVWVIRFLPIVLVLFAGNILFMLRDIKKTDSFPGSGQFFRDEYAKMPKMTKEEKASLVLFLTATLLAFLRSLYETVLPGLKPAYVFLLCGMLAFFITDREGERVMRWKQVQGKIVWELIFVFAGGLAAGTLINGSGAADAIGTLMTKTGLSGGVFTIFVIITVTLLLSDVTSNTATAAVAIPVVISIVQGLGLNPIPWIYIASVGVNLSYMLPTSIRAIPVGYGLEPKYMLREGWKLSVIVIALMTAVCSLLYYFWPAFGTV